MKKNYRKLQRIPDNKLAEVQTRFNISLYKGSFTNTVLNELVEVTPNKYLKIREIRQYKKSNKLLVLVDIYATKSLQYILLDTYCEIKKDYYNPKLSRILQSMLDEQM